MEIDLRVFSFIEVLILTIIILFAFIYSIPIICIRRFHQHNNLLTLNVCLATILCCLSWLAIFTIPLLANPYDKSRESWMYLNIPQTVFTIQVPFSFVVSSIHRYCSIVYHTKIFFKTKRWLIICIGGQWILAFILSIPNLACVCMVRISVC